MGSLIYSLDIWCWRRCLCWRSLSRSKASRVSKSHDQGKSPATPKVSWMLRLPNLIIFKNVRTSFSIPKICGTVPEIFEFRVIPPIPSTNLSFASRFCQARVQSWVWLVLIKFLSGCSHIEIHIRHNYTMLVFSPGPSHFLSMKRLYNFSWWDLLLTYSPVDHHLYNFKIIIH